MFDGEEFCYENYTKYIDEGTKLSEKISLIRFVIYSVFEPFQSPFFYWTILLLVLHKFNFKKPVLKIILAHYTLRIVGDIFDSFGLYISSYDELVDGKCQHVVVNGAEQHPLRWLLTRQIAGVFWYSGEIAGDWYPLLRTRAVAREQKSIWLVYITCLLFNLSKVSMAIFQFTVSGKQMLNEQVRKDFYAKFWVINFIILITSILYDFAVFIVLKKHIFSKANSNFGFLKKFRSISEFRILVSTIIGIIGLPIIGASTILKLYFTFYEETKKYSEVDFSLEDVRILIVNVSYYMMFIDQIMLFRSKDDSSMGDSTNLSSTTNSNLNSNVQIKPYNMDSKVYFNNLNNINSASSQNTLVSYSANNTNNLGYGRIKGHGGMGIGRNNSLANNYDDYNTNEWNYMRN